MLGKLRPRGAARLLALRQPTQEKDVGRDFRIGVLLKGGVRQSNRAEKVRLVVETIAQAGVHLVQSAFRCNEDDQSAGPHLLHAFREEVIVDEEIEIVELRVVQLVVAERDIGDGEVEGAFDEPCRFEALSANVGIRVKMPCDACGERVEFYAGEPRARRHFLGHQPEEMSDPERRFQDTAAAEAKSLHGLVDAGNDRG